MNESTSQVRSVSGLVGLVLSAAAGLYLLFAASLVVLPYIRDYTERHRFDSQRWKDWEMTEKTCCTRWHMVRDLTGRYELVGMTRSAVVDLLGAPDDEHEDELHYRLGMTGHGIDTGTLILHLDREGRVEGNEVWRG